MQAKKLGNYTGNDVELCRTTNVRVSEEMTEVLMARRIPFTKICRKIPFFRRERYNGASQVWVISINPHSYGEARRAIDDMDHLYRKRLVLSNY